METKHFLDIDGVAVIAEKIKKISEAVTEIYNQLDGFKTSIGKIEDLETELNKIKESIGDTISDNT